MAQGLAVRRSGATSIGMRMRRGLRVTALSRTLIHADTDAIPPRPAPIEAHQPRPRRWGPLTRIPIWHSVNAKWYCSQAALLTDGGRGTRPGDSVV